jgi:hypothetical protein
MSNAETDDKVVAVDRIPFDDIAPSSSVRVAVVDGVQYLSVRDIIMVMCNQNIDRAGKTWRNIPETFKTEVRHFLTSFKFKGQGQQVQAVIQFPGALKLMMWLPGEQAKQFRSKAAEILTRYYAGDKTLLNEVWANAQASAPINEAARAALPQLDAIEEYGAKRQKIMEHMEEDLALVRVIACTTREYNGYLREQVEIKRELFDMEISHERAKLEVFEQFKRVEINHETSKFSLSEQSKKSDVEHKRVMKELDLAPVPVTLSDEQRDKSKVLTVLGVYQKNKSQFAMVSHVKAKRERLVREAGVKAAAKYREEKGVEPVKTLDAGSGFEVCMYPADAEALLMNALKETYRHMCVGQNQVPISGYLILS